MVSKIQGAVVADMKFPVWAAIGMLATGIFTAGTLYSQLGSLIKDNAEFKTVLLKTQEQQNADHTDVASTKVQVGNNTQRITNLETVVYGKSPK